MKKILLLICITLAAVGCKEGDLTSFLGNEYVWEFNNIRTEILGEDNVDEVVEKLNIWLPVYEGYYITSTEYEKQKNTSRKANKICETLVFGKSDCTIRSIVNTEERIGYSNNKITIYKFQEGSFEKTQYNPFLKEDVKFVFYVRPDGLYNQATYLSGSKEESKLLSFNNGDFQFKYCSRKGDISSFEDLTYTTDNTETFTYTKIGNEILMVNKKGQIKGSVSNDFKTVTLVYVEPLYGEIRTFNYK